MKFILYSVALIFTSTFLCAQPYSITAYIEPSVIKSDDVSSLQSVVYVGQGMNWVFDRRVDDWVYINTYLFDISYDDGITSQVQVNPEFDLSSATLEAEKYAYIMGQLPACLRIGVDKIWIHMGTESFGGGFDAVLIHTGQSASYELLGILEEVLVHEATHTALDASHATSLGWLGAQNLDGGYISSYAASDPAIEDLAESFLTWIMVRQCDLRISSLDSLTISQTIPNRLAYFDSQNFNMYPLCIDPNSLGINDVGKEYDISLFPNPTNGHFRIESNTSLVGNSYCIYDLTGKVISSSQIINEKIDIDLSNLPSGIYLLNIGEDLNQIFKVIKL